jgi:hypothetical protein
LLQESGHARRTGPRWPERLIVDAPEFDAKFEVSDSAPVQAFGEVLGRELYFRARHDGWGFEVADLAGRLPSDGYRTSDGFYSQGDYANASYMPLRHPVKLITRCLQEYTGIRAEH